MARVNEIRYVGYGVADLAAEQAFCRDTWGLREVGTVDGMAYFACQGHDEHHVVRLRQSDEQRIAVIALAAADQWGIGVGGPQTIPHPHADAGLFVPAAA